MNTESENQGDSIVTKIKVTKEMIEAAARSAESPLWNPKSEEYGGKQCKRFWFTKGNYR